MKHRWTEGDVNTVMHLRKHNLPVRDIAERFGVTERAIHRLVNKVLNDRQPPYLGYLDGPPINRCPTRERQIRNAQAGSAALLSALKFAGLSA